MRTRGNNIRQGKREKFKSIIGEIEIINTFRIF